MIGIRFLMWECPIEVGHDGQKDPDGDNEQERNYETQTP